MAGNAAADPAPVDNVTGGVFVGGNLFTDEIELGNSFHDDQVPGSGVLIGVRGAYRLWGGDARTGVNPGIAAELEAKFLFSSTDSAEMRESVFSPVLGWRAHAVLDLWSHRKLVPFALAGLGGETLVSGSRFVDSPDTDAAIHLGLGSRYGVGDRFGIRGDVRAGVTAGRFDLAAPTFELHVGVFYRFGRRGRQPTAVDPTVVQQPPRATPNDSDGDGIAGAADLCPTQPEIVNHIDDDDGCPEIDSDNDGLVGMLDGCPDAAEDIDGFEDGNGCPDTDNDGDGRPDPTDRCPTDAEVVNGYEDEDGCPDELPSAVAAFTGVIEGIRFKTGSARIVGSSRKILGRAVGVLRQYPAIRVQIAGHTDITGGNKLNLALSRKRADYVKWYLVDKGIDEARIETVGFGAHRPIADNESDWGRAKNRRIEFQLLPGASNVLGPHARD